MSSFKAIQWGFTTSCCAIVVAHRSNAVHSVVPIVRNVVRVSVCGADDATELATEFADFQTTAPASLDLPFFHPPVPDLPFTSFPFLDNVAPVALPSNPSIDDLFSRNSNTALNLLHVCLS